MQLLLMDVGGLQQLLPRILFGMILIRTFRRRVLSSPLANRKVRVVWPEFGTFRRIQAHGVHHARYFQVLNYYEVWNEPRRSQHVYSGTFLWPAFSWMKVPQLDALREQDSAGCSVGLHKPAECSEHNILYITLISLLFSSGISWVRHSLGTD